MKEIEILVRVENDEEDILKTLSKFDFQYEKNTVDTYYFDPLRENLKPDNNNHLKECLRVRETDDKNYLTYKVDVFDKNNDWLYSNEDETQVLDASIVKKIIENLGLQELITVDCNKRIYKEKEYEISFEKVKNLGNFLEVELCTELEVDIQKIIEEIRAFIKKFNLKTTEIINMGKPEMMIRKNKGETV
jgi:adenylate cyclase class 2